MYAPIVCVCVRLSQVQQLAEQLLRAEIAAVSPNATGADDADADALHRDLPTKLVKMVQVQPQGPRSPAPSDLIRNPSVTRGAPAVPACCYRTAFGPTGTALPSRSTRPPLFISPLSSSARFTCRLRCDRRRTACCCDPLPQLSRRSLKCRLSLQLEKTASQAQLDAKEFWKHLEASAHEDL